MLNLVQHPVLRPRGGWQAGPWNEFRVTAAAANRRGAFSPR